MFEAQFAVVFFLVVGVPIFHFILQALMLFSFCVLFLVLVPGCLGNLFLLLFTGLTGDGLLSALVVFFSGVAASMFASGPEFSWMFGSFLSVAGSPSVSI